MKPQLFKGDKYKDKDGYIYIKAPNDLEQTFKSMVVRGYMPEHRYNLAKHLNRLLKSTEQVHHKDKNRENNLIENLELVDALKHIYEHRDKGDLKLFSKNYQPRWNRMKTNNLVRQSLNVPKKENKQFNMGMKTELEHKDITGGNPILTGKIVKAHLKEMGDYYTKLNKMENEGKKSKNLDNSAKTKTNKNMSGQIKKAGHIWNAVKKTGKAGLAVVSPTYRGAKIYQAGVAGKSMFRNSINSLKRLKSSASEEFTRSGIDRIRGMFGKGRTIGDKVKDTMSRYKGKATSNDVLKKKLMIGGGAAAAAGLGALALSRKNKQDN